MRRAVRGGEGRWSVCVDALVYVDVICGRRGNGEEGRPHLHGAVFGVSFGCDGSVMGSSAGVVRKLLSALWPVARIMGDGAEMTD
jgi:hypothetical protein